MKTNYQSLLEKVNAASTKEEFKRIEKLCTTIYNAGQLTPKELSRLDVKIMELSTLKEIKIPRASDCGVSTWFERDRQHVHLFHGDENETILEWWDDDVTQAVEDGFLNPKNYEGSAKEYAISLGLIN